MWRRLVIVVAVFIGALAGCVFALTSPRVAESLRWRISQLARDRFGVELTLRELQINLFPPSVEVHGVTLADNATTPPWLTAHSARVIVQPWPSPTGAVIVQELEVDGLETDLTRFVVGVKPNEAAPPKRTTKLPVDVLTLYVWNTRAMIRSPDAGPIVFDDVQLAMRPTPASGRSIWLDVGSVSATPETGPLKARLAARASFYGSIDDPQRITVNELSIENPTIAIRGNGQVRMAQMDFSVHVDTTAELEKVLTLVPNAPHIGGNGRVQLDIDGSPLGVKGELIADVTNVTVPGRPRPGNTRPRVELGNVGVRAHYDSGVIAASSITIDHPRAGRLAGSATVGFSGQLPLHVNAKVKHASLPEILDLAGLPDAWVRLIFDGDIEVSGNLKPFALDLRVDGHGDDLRVSDHSYRTPKSRIALALDDIGLRGGARLSGHNISLVDMGITLKGGRYVANGTLDFDPQVGLAIEVDSEHANLGDLGSIAGLKLEGEGSLHGAIAGGYRDLTISGIADMKQLVVQGYPIGDGSGELTFHNPKLELEHFTIHRHEGTAQGSASIDFGAPGMPAKATLTVEHVDLSSALADVGIPQELAVRLSARVSGEVAVDGPLLAPVGTATLHTQSFGIDGVDMGATDFRGGFDATPWAPVPGEKPAELAWGQIAMKPRGGLADARAAYRKDNTLSLIANMNVVPIALITPFIGNIPMGGTVSGRVNLEGAHGNIMGTASARLHEWTVYDAHLETSSVEATFEPGKVLLSAELLSGDASGKAVVMLDGLGTYEARFAGTRLDFARVLPVTGPVTVIVDGALVAKGSIAKADSMVADITLPAAEVTWKHAKMKSVDAVQMRFDNRTLRVLHMKLAGQALELDISGDAPLDGALDIHIKGGGALTALKDVSPRIQSAEGTLALDLRTRGTFAAMELDGVASIRNGQVRATNTRQALEDVTADMSFAGDTLTLDSATASVGGGTLKMEGQLVLGRDEAPDVSLRAELGRVTIQPMSDATATLTGALQLSGHMDDLLLAGHVKVDQARYTQNIELGSFVPDQGSRPLQVPAMEPTEVVRLAVGISTPNNIIVSNNVLEAELRADLTVTGTSNRIGLLGTVNTLWARARYRNNVFNVERAAVDFTDEYRIFTQFDVRATTKACNIDARVSIYGDSNSYNISATGSDLKGVVDQQDVLACLQFGLRLSGFNNEQGGATATIRDTYAGGLDALWTVSGMDEKVKRVLPIQLDEVRVTSSWSTRARRTTARILVGKDIGKNVILRYSRSIEDDTDHNVALEYRLSNLATVQGTWLSVTDLPIADFGLDLRLRWELR